MALKESIKIETGLQSWITTGTLPNSKVGIELLKLHGSLDWTWRTPDLFLRQFEERPEEPSHKHIAQISTEGMVEKLNYIKNNSRSYRNETPAIIFGGRNKLTTEGPFLDLLIRFKERLQLSKNLLVVGYSFRDAHINHLIESWLRSRLDVTMIVIDKPNGSFTDIDFLSKLAPDFQARIKYESSGAERGIATNFTC